MIKSTKACFKKGLSASSLNLLVSYSRREGEAEERYEIPSFHHIMPFTDQAHYALSIVTSGLFRIGNDCYQQFRFL